MSSLCAPILTIESVTEPVGDGCKVSCYQKDANNSLKLYQQTSIFEERGHNVRGLTYLNKYDILLAYGERLMAVVCKFFTDPQKKVYSCQDWIQALLVFSESSEMERFVEFVTLSINNEVQLFQLNIMEENSVMDVKQVASVKSNYRSTIMYSVLDGSSWNTLRSIVGTVMGNIIISYPSQSSSPIHVLKYHSGMIFGLLVKGELLLSISDDRSLHLWDLKNAKHIDKRFGHPTRPFTICDGPRNLIFTGGQDGSICFWKLDESSASLLEVIHTEYGVIRSLLFTSQELVFGTNCGFLGSITFSGGVEKNQTVDVIHSDFSVQSFIPLCDKSYFISDSEGILYRLANISQDEIMKCGSIRFMKMSPCKKYVSFPEDNKLHMVRVYDNRCFCFCASDQILDLFWIETYVLLVLMNNKNILVHLSEDMSDWMSYNFQIHLQEIISCVTYLADCLFLGTRKGSIVVLENFKITQADSGAKIKQIIKRAHGKDRVMDIISYNTRLLSVGRDGKLCIWKRGNQLRLLSSLRSSTWLQMEWPCMFLKAWGQLYIAGFRGTNFVVLHFDSGHCVCDLWCGGGHRPWWLSVLHKTEKYEASKLMCFEFVMKAKISKVVFSINDLKVIKPNLHLSDITSIATIEMNKSLLYVTSGIDTTLVLFRLLSSETVEVLQRLYTHSSSIFCIAVMDLYLISAGGKSEIFIFILDGENLQQLLKMRLDVDCRLLSICFITVSPYIRFLVSGSDGRLLIYELSKTLDVQKFIVLLGTTDDVGIMTKVSCASLSDSIICSAISSTGKLLIWNFSELLEEKCTKTFDVEQCGLSALDMYTEDGILYVAVGSESGRIFFYEARKNLMSTKCMNHWHSATCTAFVLLDDFLADLLPNEIIVDLRIHRTLETYLLISIALDCRLAMFCYSSTEQQLTFQHSVLLNIYDPSSLIVSVTHNNMAKCTIVGTSVCIVYFNNSFPYFFIINRK
ncbi:unnamed protein product [Thelazia callipaeda]|uniref:tRNA (34-2'-O)-methyltransferase regulator WDR6 n=1 Tax=Thelazia callipaeda TaxID=103827 RepID=A0A0N5D9N5_THECL|nr:unnamed protein product [Thelazia callipaeda]